MENNKATKAVTVQRTFYYLTSGNIYTRIVLVCNAIVTSLGILATAYRLGRVCALAFWFRVVKLPRGD